MPGEVQVITVACNHCGAPLQVQADTRFVTCAYCNHQLEVHRSPTSIYTQTLESIDQRTQQMADDIQAIKQQNELEALDRQWMLQQQQYMVSDKHGNQSAPSAAGGLIGAVIAAAFGIFWIGMTVKMGAPGFFPLFGVLFIVIALVGGVRSLTRASDFETARQDYQRKRREILGRTPNRPPPAC